MNYSANKNILQINNSQVTFSSEIKEMMTFGKVLVVVLDDDMTLGPKNVKGINMDGEEIWTVEQTPEIKESYTGVFHVNDHIARLFNWDGYYYEVNTNTGEFTQDVFAFREGKRPW